MKLCLPPLLLSLAYPGAYPLEKMDELVKAVWGKDEARGSSHFSVEREVKEQDRESRRKEMVGRESGTQLERRKGEREHEYRIFNINQSMRSSLNSFNKSRLIRS